MLAGSEFIEGFRPEIVQVYNPGPEVQLQFAAESITVPAGFSKMATVFAEHGLEQLGWLVNNWKDEVIALVSMLKGSAGIPNHFFVNLETLVKEAMEIHQND